jgi:microcystin-dependent protein
MSDQYVAEIRMFAGTFAPSGWALCNGQILPINQNTALFSLLGTNYGGNGTSTFGLPNLQGSAPLGYGQGPGLSARYQGQIGGEQSVTLLTQQIPSHTHAAQAATAGGSVSPAGAVWGEALLGKTPLNIYAPGPGAVPMSPQALGLTGGNQPHNNLPPYLCVTFIIALTGIFPPRS